MILLATCMLKSSPVAICISIVPCSNEWQLPVIHVPSPDSWLFHGNHLQNGHFLAVCMLLAAPGSEAAMVDRTAGLTPLGWALAASKVDIARALLSHARSASPQHWSASVSQLLPMAPYNGLEDQGFGAC